MLHTDTVPEPDQQDWADVGWQYRPPGCSLREPDSDSGHNFGIRISRNNVIKSIQFHVDNQNISVNSKHIQIIQQRICCRLTTVKPSKWFPWLTTGLWMLTRNWVMFLQDMHTSHSVTCAMIELTASITDSLRTTSRDAECFIHNKEHAFESSPSDRKQNGGALFSSDGWWGESSRVLWRCAILCILRVVLILKSIKCSINTYDHRKYRFFVRIVYSLKMTKHDNISALIFLQFFIRKIEQQNEKLYLIYWWICYFDTLESKSSKLTTMQIKENVTGLCSGNWTVTGEFPHKWPVTRKMFPFDDVIM